MTAPKTLDGMCQAVIDQCGPSAAVPWALMASLIYYHADTALLSDTFFDKLMHLIADKWDSIDGTQKYIIGRDGRNTTSLFDLKIENYPHSTRAAAFVLVNRSKIPVSMATRLRILRADFIPPAHCWDSYEYEQGLTYRQWREKHPALASKLEGSAVVDNSVYQLFLESILHD